VQGIVRARFLHGVLHLAVASKATIGIVGGVGPYAALDLANKICDETLASRDQDHLPVALISYPHLIPDRTAFILGETDLNPATPILGVIEELERAGCRVVGIPCNTAHAPAIWDVIVKGLLERGSAVKLLHMVEEAAAFVRTRWPAVGKVGVLSTIGTQRSGVYPEVFGRHGLEVVTLEESEQRELVHASVYDPQFGIKAQASPVSERVRRNMAAAVERVRAAGAEVVVLACTELPLAVPERVLGGTPIVDSTRVLARALIRTVAPGLLRP
jgi:aspartate racemase